MKTQVKGTGMAVTPDIQSYLDKKIAALAKLFPQDSAARIDVEVGRTTVHHQTGDIFRAEFNLHATGNYFRAVAEEPSVFAAIDSAEGKLLREVRHAKHRSHSVLRRTGARIKDMMHWWKGEDR